MSQLASAQPIRLIVGLGNPGPEYEATRHNVGFWFVEQLAADNATNLRREKKFHGRYAKLNLEGHELHLLCPDTFMNLSGRAVQAIATYYDIAPEAILIIHDELDLALGTVKLKFAGGHGGHNGLRNIIEQLHSKAFMRLRLGIGRPPNAGNTERYVLSRMPSSQQQILQQAMRDADRILPDLLSGEHERAMLHLHSQ